MPEKIKELEPPRGIARLAFRMPILFYRWGLGGLLGSRFLLLTHTGRKSGLKRQVVLEVVRHDKETNTFVVAAGFGEKSAWYQNIQVKPQVNIRSGSGQWEMTASFLTADQAGEELSTYAKRYPMAMRELARFMGYRLDGTPEDIQAMGQTIPMVAFHPTGFIGE